MFSQFDALAGTNSPTTTAGGERTRSTSGSTTRYPSRERTVILQLLNDIGIVGGPVTHSRARLSTDGGAAVMSMHAREQATGAAGGAVGDGGNDAGASQSLSAPCTPTGVGKLPQRVSSVSWEQQPQQRRPAGGGGGGEASTVAMMPSWPVVAGGGRAVGVGGGGGSGGGEVGGGGGGAVGGLCGIEAGARRRSGINPYMARR